MASASAQKGFLYEKNAAAYLKDIGLCPKNFVPAGAGHDQPDLMLLYKGQEAGCELKITAASAGSLVMKYNVQKQEWGFNPIPADEKEKLFIKELADEVGLWKIVNKKWDAKNKRPYKIDRKDQDALWKATAGKLQGRERYTRDHGMFPEQNGEIDSSKIESYYNKKATYYVNVGTHGFYLLGHHNPYQLPAVPRFNQKASAKWRARVQSKGGGTYQFTFEMTFSIQQKSPYNIAPILGSQSVSIQKDWADVSCFREL